MSDLVDASACSGLAASRFVKSLGAPPPGSAPARRAGVVTHMTPMRSRSPNPRPYTLLETSSATTLDLHLHSREKMRWDELGLSRNPAMLLVSHLTKGFGDGAHYQRRFGLAPVRHGGRRLLPKPAPGSQRPPSVSWALISLIADESLSSTSCSTSTPRGPHDERELPSSHRSWQAFQRCRSPRTLFSYIGRQAVA